MDAKSWDSIAERLENGEDPKDVAMRCRMLAQIQRADREQLERMVKVMESVNATT